MSKNIIYKLVHQGAHNAKIYRGFDYFIISLILLNAVVIMLETIE